MVISQQHLSRLISVLNSDWTCEVLDRSESVDMKTFIRNVFNSNHIRLTDKIFIAPEIKNVDKRKIILSLNVYSMIDKHNKQFIGKVIDAKKNNDEAIITLQDDYERYSIIIQVVS